MKTTLRGGARFLLPALVLLIAAGGRARAEAPRNEGPPPSGIGDRVARNAGQRWVARFDGRGFEVIPDNGQWTWGLEVRHYGFPAAERALDSTVPVVSSRGNTVSYSWGDGFSEWYVNDRRGLEHGWTFDRRPGGAREGEPLVLEFGVRGGLRPAVDAGGVQVSFVGNGGERAVIFGGLQAWDADGRMLPTRFEEVAGASGGMRVVVDERGARYPLMIDPVAQQAYAKASNTGPGDVFGYSVAISGNTLVVGAPGEDSPSTGVDGSQGDAIPGNGGAAYVFVRIGSTWVQQAYLKPSNTGSSIYGDNFGNSVAISGDTVIVGAPDEDSAATGINGNQTSNSAQDAGAAYVFVRNGTTWTQQAYFKASNAETWDRFGIDVAISGDTAVVGAHGESSAATGVNGNQADNGAGSAGAAYVFVRNGATWTQQAYFKASNAGADDRFGTAVAISGETVLVGAFQEASVATGINGNGADNSAFGAGAAYVFQRTGTTWTEQAYLKASNTGTADWFGYGVGISGNTAVVGASDESSSATGINGNQGNNGALQSGAAYVFERTGATWAQQAYLKASNTNPDDRFGSSAAVAGDTILIGAEREGSNATGVNGNQTNNSLSIAGAAYLFTRNGTNWAQRAYLKASNTDADDSFGTRVAVADDTAVIGAYREAGNATGINGNQTSNSAASSGAAYVFLAPAPQAEIAVERSPGFELLDGWSRRFGAPPNRTQTLRFTVRNLGEIDLTGLNLTITGTDESNFSAITQPVAPLAPGANTAFDVRFAPATPGVKNAALHLASNDSNENPFDIVLLGQALSPDTDTDGDGLGDVAEFEMAAQNFDWQVAQPALVASLFLNAHLSGLYTETEIGNLYAPAPLIEVQNGTVSLNLQIQKSDDLVDWGPFGAPVQRTEPAGDKRFYRVFVEDLP